MSDQPTVLPNYPLTKALQQERAKMILDLVENGELEPWRALILGKALEKLSKQIVDGVKDEAYTAVNLMPKGDRVFMGVRLSTSKGSQQWSYDHDSRWQQLKAEVNEATAVLNEKKVALKAHQALMVALAESRTGDVADVSDGEMLSPAIPGMFSGAKISVNFPDS